MEGLKQYTSLSNSARLLIFHTYRMNEKGEKVTRKVLKNMFGKEITSECLKEIFSQNAPLLVKQKSNIFSKEYKVSDLMRSYFRLL